MTLNELRYITAVVEDRSISKAAERLFIAQPSLSQAVQKVERRYGCEFFIRTKNGLRLTKEGEIYVKNAYEILRINRQLELELGSVDSSYRRTIFIGTNVNHGHYFFPQAFPKFQERYPDIYVCLIEGNSAELEDKLLNGIIDFSVTRFPFTNPNIEFRILGNERFVLVTKRDHPLGAYAYDCEGFVHPFVDLKLFEEEVFLLSPPNEHVRTISDQILHKAGFLPKSIMEIRSLSLQRDMCAITSSVALMPQILLEDSSHCPNPNVTYFHIEDKYCVPYSLALATVLGRELSNPVKDFITLVLAHNSLSAKADKNKSIQHGGG